MVEGLLRTLVSTRSLSRQEGEVADVLQGWLESQDLPVERIENNVIVRLQGAKPGRRMLLNSHLDTVSAGDGWSRDPWEPWEQGGRLYGLGSGDAKGSIAAMSVAMAQIQAQGGVESGELIFAATIMEEVGGGGLEDVVGEFGELDGALVGEPTSLQPALAQGGLLLLEASARGKTAHSARAQLGKNALLVAARDLLTLEALELDKIHPLLGRSTANATVIRGGERHNVIPDLCEFTIDIRYTPSYTPEAIREILGEALQSELRLRSDRLKPVETAGDSALVRSLLAMLPEGQPFGSPTMSDWVHLAGVDAVKIGPGDSEQSHRPDESIELAQLRAAVEVYAGCALGFLV